VTHRTGNPDTLHEMTFSLAEARGLMPDVHSHAAEVVRLRADLAELALDLRHRGSSPLGGKADAKAFEARISESVSWFTDQGIEIKGIAPLLIDFPAELDGQSVRLCWLEGEPELAWYHLTELGFLGRRRL
jgi:hypothetical protein